VLSLAEIQKKVTPEMVVILIREEKEKTQRKEPVMKRLLRIGRGVKVRRVSCVSDL
jgi:hypothetical protein